MIRSLHIRKYILIDSLDIDFPKGLVIITGQTGAGKSILLGALSLLSGSKSDASMIAAGADSCVVEAEYICSDPELDQIFEQEDIEKDEDRIIIRRVVSSSGRSRSFVNDCPVSLSVLQSIAAKLVDIHSQHASLSLSQRGYQMSVLDFFAGNSQLKEQCYSLWRELQGTRTRLAELKERLARFDAEKEYNTAQFKQLEDAHLQKDELSTLEEEHRSLANSEQIKEGLGAAIGLLSSDDNMVGVCSALKEAARRLAQIGSVFPSVAAYSERLESARIETEDILSDLLSIDSSIDMSQERLNAVEERLSHLYMLLKKHSCTNVEELITLRDEYKTQLFDSSKLEADIEDLSSREKSLKSSWGSVCEELSKSRRSSAPKLAEAVMQSLRFLELERSVFEVKVEECDGGADGKDKISFLFSSDGRNPMELSKVASGGELSRIMLSLKSIKAQYTGMPTLIFDEIDTGVSGSVADKMGQMVCDMGRNMQVFAITHLPQVAAKGDAHYLVRKQVGADGLSVSHLDRIEGQERVMEVARLLSGSTISEAAIANAQDLLG